MLLIEMLNTDAIRTHIFSKDFIACVCMTSSTTTFTKTTKENEALARTASNMRSSLLFVSLKTLLGAILRTASLINKTNGAYMASQIKTNRLLRALISQSKRPRFH